jgi:uncharacterized membrane protein YhaH (DUF805 family)
MNNAAEIQPYVELLTDLVSSILFVVLAAKTRELAGRGWLIAYVAPMLLTIPAFQLVHLLAEHSSDPTKIYPWYDVLNVPGLFRTACFGIFLLCIWSRTRIKLDAANLLFSPSGRIPRSVFWILVCILFPLGTMLGFAPLTTKAEGLPKAIIWIVYAAWMLLSIWISISVYAKRWHDCGRSGWMTLILLIPLVGPFWFFGYCGFVRGTSGPNKYGGDPLDLETDTAAPQPPQPAPAPPSASQSYFLSVDGKDSGPHSLDEMRRLRQAGRLTDDTLVFRQGDQGWQPASKFSEI